MTVTMAGSPIQAASRQPLPPQWVPAGPRPSVGVRAGQVVAAQVAVALLATAAGRGVGPTAGALFAAALLLPGAWVRVRGRWLFEWLGIGLGYLTRRRTLSPAAGPAALLDLVTPGAAVFSAELAGGPGAVVNDPGGLAALLEIGDPGGLLAEGPRALPSPLALLPPVAADSPPIRVQLLLSGSPALAPGAGGGTVTTSYRQLTDGLLAGQQRAVLAVRVLRVDGWSDEDLRRALASAVRKVIRRLGSLATRPLGERAALRVLGELAHHDGDHPAQESWQAVRSGGLLQTTFRLQRWPDLSTEGGRQLVSRLLALPALATTVSVCAGPRTGADPAAVPAELTIRLAADTPADLSIAARALRRLVGSAGGEVRRLDGEQLKGLAATLPLAIFDAGTVVSGPGLDALELSLGAAGLMIGTNRHGGAVVVRLFRPEGTRLLLVGGVHAAQLVVLRAMALGARAVVQTTRPRVWEPFVRGVGVPGGTIPVLPPGRPVGGAPGSPLHPLLLIVDAGPVVTEPAAGPGWRATLVIRDELTAVDTDSLARADLVVLQPLDPAEASLAGTALGLGGSAEWLTRIREDMVAVLNRRALRWALLSPTPIESQLIGQTTRR